MNMHSQSAVNLTAPPITVSTLDLQRIERLLDRPEYRDGYDELRDELNRANLVDPVDVPPDLVTMNSSVLFCDESTHEEYGLTLVYPSRNNSRGGVSILAPVGSALLGLSVGQAISWQIPGRRQLCLRVLRIISQPEANGEYHL
jgi:regulator of nucleoside diphosphate kinase